MAWPESRSSGCKSYAPIMGPDHRVKEKSPLSHSFRPSCRLYLATLVQSKRQCAHSPEKIRPTVTDPRRYEVAESPVSIALCPKRLKAIDADEKRVFDSSSVSRYCLTGATFPATATANLQSDASNAHGGTTNYPAIKVRWVKCHDNAGRQPFPNRQTDNY